MPYVQRDQSGVVIGLYSCQQDPAVPWLAEDHADVIAFRAAIAQTATSQAQIDSQLAVDVIAARAYVKLTALRGMTPAQIQAWVQANVTTLAAAQDAITTLAIAVSILARRL